MTLPLTPEMLETSYNFLKTIPPFSKMGLPDSDDVKFVVCGDPAIYGRWDFDGGEHTISVSCKTVGYVETLLSTMSHEMIHMKVGATNQRAHSMAFRKLGKQACKYLGFDPKSFI